MLSRLLLALIVALPAAAQAQFRSIPAQAKRGELRHVQAMVVEIDGKQARLAPGAQIRDGSNRIVVPAALPSGALPSGALVKYLLDAQGMVARVWILTPQEAAQPDPRR